MKLLVFSSAVLCGSIGLCSALEVECPEQKMATNMLQTGLQAMSRSKKSQVGRLLAGSGDWPSGHGLVSQYSWSTQDRVPFDLSEKTLAWKWSHPEGRFHTLTYATAMDEDKAIYLSAADGVRKFSKDGQVQWERGTLPAEVTTAGSLYKGAFYNSAVNGSVFALDQTTGRTLWNTRVSESIGQDNGFVMVNEGVVIAAGSNGLQTGFVPQDPPTANLEVHCLSAKDGSKLWTFKPDNAIWNFMASFPNDGTVLFQDITGKAYRLKLADGSLIWKNGGITNTWTDGSATLGGNNIFYTVANMKGNEPHTAEDPGVLSAYDLATGKLLWGRETPRPPNNAPAVGILGTSSKLSVVQPLGQQVLQGAATDVIAYDAETGEVQWIFNGPSQKGPYQAADLEGTIERLSSGVRSMCLPNGWSAPSISADGVVYVGNEEGNFYALRDKNGDGKVEGPEEVSSFDTLACFAGTAAPSLVDDTVAVASCDSLFVFKNPL